jgi:hypothetical protein
LRDAFEHPWMATTGDDCDRCRELAGRVSELEGRLGAADKAVAALRAKRDNERARRLRDERELKTFLSEAGLL